jgi:hypothetical protein
MSIRDRRRSSRASLCREHPGAIAFSRAGDPNIGEFEDAKILLSIGKVMTIERRLEEASM